MITRDKSYFGLAVLCLIIQISTIPISKFLGDTIIGFYGFWLFTVLMILIPTIILITSSRPFIASSTYAAFAALISMASLLMTLGYTLIAR